jgi:hypothetical protein
MPKKDRGVLDWMPDEDEWAAWLKKYGAKNFLIAFLEIAQDAESFCVYCRQKIYLDIIEGGGTPDWRTEDGDYGCEASPDANEEMSGSHMARKLKS